MLLGSILSNICFQLANNARKVQIPPDNQTVYVTYTPELRLKMLDFCFNHQSYRIIQQNPQHDTKWGEMARNNNKIFQVMKMPSMEYIGVFINNKYVTYIRPNTQLK